jgi:hypothetical protein
MVAEIDNTNKFVRLVIIRNGPVILKIEVSKANTAIKESTTYTQ